MKVIALLNEKGGVGKTTLSTHIAAGLAIKGYTVVLADTDAQANATIAFGLPKEPGFYDLIVRDARYEDVLRVVSPERYIVPDEAAHIKGRLLVLPSNTESRAIANQITDARIVLERFHQLQGVVDFIVVDTAPTPSLLHGTIYLATDGILYPTRCEAWAFDGLRESMGHKATFDPYREQRNMLPIAILGIVPVAYRAQTVEHSENLRKLQQAFGELVWAPVPLSITWAEAAGEQKSVFAIAPMSDAAQRAWKIVERIEAIYVEAR